MLSKAVCLCGVLLHVFTSQAAPFSHFDHRPIDRQPKGQKVTSDRSDERRKQDQDPNQVRKITDIGGRQETKDLKGIATGNPRKAENYVGNSDRNPVLTNTKHHDRVRDPKDQMSDETLPKTPPEESDSSDDSSSESSEENDMSSESSESDEAIEDQIVKRLIEDSPRYGGISRSDLGMVFYSTFCGLTAVMALGYVAYRVLKGPPKKPSNHGV